jgi:hypothetical protein
VADDAAVCATPAKAIPVHAKDKNRERQRDIRRRLLAEKIFGFSTGSSHGSGALPL